MYVLRMRLCNDMVYSYVDCLSERASIVNGKFYINTETVQASKQLICKYCMQLCNCATVSFKEPVY